MILTVSHVMPILEYFLAIARQHKCLSASFLHHATRA